MTEPSAWAMEQARALYDHMLKYKQGISQRDVAEALDAAWRAGAEAMMRRAIRVCHEHEAPDIGMHIEHADLPEPGEER